MVKIQLYALIASAFVLGLLGIYSAGMARGQDKIKRKIDEKRLDNINIKNEVEDELDAADDTYLAHRASRWLRNKD